MSHPLHQFTYCPKCGARTFVERNEKAKQCTACGFVYYFNPSSAVACFIRNPQGELLLVLPCQRTGQRNARPARRFCRHGRISRRSRPQGSEGRNRTGIDRLPLPFLHSQHLSLLWFRCPHRRYVFRMPHRILQRSKSRRRCCRDHYPARQPVESGRFRIAIYQKSSRPLYKVIYFLYLQLRTNIYRYIYIYLYYKS